MTFIERVSSEDWRHRATAWIDSALAGHGVERTGPVEQPRIRPWSTQLTVPVVDGTVWFKANCPGLAHEAALHAELARLVPDEVDEPLGVELAEGWLLTRDRGATMTAEADPSLDQWCAVVEVAADLQRRLVRHTDALLATGVPDCSPTTIADRFDAQIAALSALPAGHPYRLDADLRSKLEGARSLVERAAQILDHGPFPSTLDHGDLHPGNVFDTPEGLRLFDFGDAEWAAAPEMLVQVWGWLRRSELPVDRAFAAYASAWSDVATRAEFDEAFDAVMTTRLVNRSTTWSHALADSTVAEQGEWADAPLYYLTKVLEPGAD